jgi:hypothetical protein
MTTLDIIVTIVTLLSSIGALYISMRKQQGDKEEQKQRIVKLKSEMANQDIDTINSLYDTIKKQEDLNKELRKEFEEFKITSAIEFSEYKTTMTRQIADIASENVRLQTYIKRLIGQLRAAGIAPEKYDV